MIRNALDDSPDRDPADGSNSNRVTQSLSCSDCAATNFPNLSKLNKHRNTHEKPYECLAEDCYERFAQRQALTRHTETKHGDARNPTKYYHCTVDGCKYSSTGRWRKRFMRADQVKEHIKDYGHYGPHSANDRPRRPGERLLTIHRVTARFEEWVVDENGDTQPRRTVHSCEYNSFRTKLWHTDVAGDAFLLGDEGVRDGHICPIEGCYYELRPPEGCERVMFKTLRALEEHYRRAHGPPGLGSSLATQLAEAKRKVNVSSWASTESYSMVNSSADSDMQSGPLDFLGLGTFASDDLKNMDSNYQTEIFPNLPHLTFCSAGSGIDCYCQSCCQRETATPQQSQSIASQLLEVSSQMQFTTVSSSSSLHDSYFSHSDTTSGTENNQFGLQSSKSTSLFRHNSLKSRTKPRLSCDFPSCTITFRRKYEKQRHIETVHSPPTLTCFLCDRRFQRRDKLKDHLRHVHGVPRPDLVPKEAKSLMSDHSSDFPSYSGPGFLSERDVVPGDTLMKMNADSSSASWTARSTSVEEAWSSRQDSGWLDIGEWRSASPKTIQSGTSNSPICLDEPTPNTTLGALSC